MKHFKKSWPADFADDRKPLEDQFHVQYRLKILADERDPPSTILTNETRIGLEQPMNPGGSEDGEPNHLVHFLQGVYDRNSTSEEQEILEFCEGAHQSCLNQNNRDQRKAAWLDDRPHSFYQNNLFYLPPPERLEDSSVSQQEPTHCGDSDHHDPTSNEEEDLPFRKYEQPLSAQRLFDNLKEKQFGHSKLPNADRRLISIVDLSPQYVLALTETALPHQAPSLTDGIYNHLARQTCMSVNIPPTGYKVFRLRFNVPFYALRKAPPKDHMKDGVFTKPRRKYRDVSFLATKKPTSSTDVPLGLHQSHISITICGVANCRWTAYSFSNADYDDGKELPDDDFESEGAIPDHIAADNDMDANIPTFSPREYFLRVVSIRLKKVVDEWAKIVREFENGILADNLPSIKTPSPEHEDGTTFDLTEKARLLLDELHNELEEIIQVWKQFSSPTGDISYFYDSQDALASLHGDGQTLTQWVHEIQRRFDDLENLKRRLSTLMRPCERMADLLALRLMLESNKSAKESGSITELMVTWVSPVALVSAFFAIPEPFGGFPRTGASFAWAYIVVFLVLQFLVINSKGQIRPNTIWQKCKNTERLGLGAEDFRGRLYGMRRLFRADTNATLVADTTVADA